MQPNAGNDAMTARKRSAIAPAVLLLGLCCTTAQAAPAAKTFRDWIVGCDNLKSCTALSLPAETAEHISILKLTRPAGPQGALKAEVKIRAEQLKAPLSVAMTIDGAAFPAPGKTWPTASGDGENAGIELSPSEADALIAAARKASKVTVTIAGRTLDMSLAGSVAALLWMDEQQGRLNTTSALIRKGPGTAVPAAPALPVITAKGTTAPALPAKTVKALTGSLRAHLKRTDPDACDDRPDSFTDSDNVWPLGGTLRLVGLLCSAGAYNLTTGFWIVSGDDIAKARKANFPQLDGGEDNTLINADFASKEGTMSYFGKARGIGDCGSSGSYAWTGSAFELTELSEMGECRGITSDDWPTLFRSELKLAK